MGVASSKAHVHLPGRGSGRFDALHEMARHDVWKPLEGKLFNSTARSQNTPPALSPTVFDVNIHKTLIALLKFEEKKRSCSEGQEGAPIINLLKRAASVYCRRHKMAKTRNGLIIVWGVNDHDDFFVGRWVGYVSFKPKTAGILINISLYGIKFALQQNASFWTVSLWPKMPRKCGRIVRTKIERSTALSW